MVQSLTLNWSFWLLWLVGFLGFPLGGLAANLTVGPVNNPVRGVLAGTITGAMIGAAQWLILRNHLALPIWWIPTTALGMAVGLGVGVALLGSETSGNALLYRALITGLCIGAAQWFLLRDILPESSVWIPVITLAWALGWFLTRCVGVNLDYHWSVFGAVGAVTFQIVVGIVLVWLTRPVTA